MTCGNGWLNENKKKSEMYKRYMHVDNNKKTVHVDYKWMSIILHDILKIDAHVIEEETGRCTESEMF